MYGILNVHVPTVHIYMYVYAACTVYFRATISFLSKLRGCDSRRQRAFVQVAERSEVFGHAVYWTLDVVNRMGNLIG